MFVPTDQLERFTLRGEVIALSTLAKAADGRQRASRPMGGWLMTYGKLGPDGGVVPTVDRDGHTVEAARELGKIDWSDYLKGGRWNDTHDEGIIVGLPDALEFHDGTTPLSKAHGKVGFWTTGRLFDRDDASSWRGLTDGSGRERTPSPIEFERADHFWTLAHLLKGLPRPIGLSAHGLMALSPCRKRIVFAKVNHAAVCELPKNPDATLEPMEFAVAGSPLEFLRKGMVGASPCGACRCPPGACEGLLAKGGVTSSSLSAAVPADLEGAPDPNEPTPLRIERLARMLAEQYSCDVATARRWIVSYLRRTNREAPGHDHDEPRPR